MPCYGIGFGFNTALNGAALFQRTMVMDLIISLTAAGSRSTLSHTSGP